MDLRLYPEFTSWHQKEVVVQTENVMLPNQYLYSIVETEKEIKKVQEILKILTKNIK